MNIVFAKHHNHQKQFAFHVPDALVPHIKKDMDVLVETKQGLQMARTVTGIFSGDGAIDVAAQGGAYLPLKPVVSIITKEAMDAIQKQVQNDLIRRIVESLHTKPDTYFPYSDLLF